jgi:DNA-binding transcriptional LysR family regulator
MELRLLRYFVAVAEELHFGKAAQRLHIEVSPLSRAIKDLEYSLGARLFERTTRSTRITRAGQVLLEDARRLLASVKETKRNVAAAANGFQNCLRIGLSDGATQPRLASVLARTRAEESDLEVRVYSMSFEQQLKGLRHDQLDVAFALTDDTGAELIAEPVWRDPLVAILPSGHPLEAQRRVTPEDVLRYPLILCHPDKGSGSTRQIEGMLREMGVEPLIADHVTTFGMMLTLVGAGFGVGFALGTRAATTRRSDIVVRPFEKGLSMATFLLRAAQNGSQPLERFIERTRACGPAM